MTLTLDLDLNKIPIDLNLVRRVPYNLATYYVALPLAHEDDWVTVVMAHPDNKTALAVLGNVLKARIVPVRGSAEAILATLKRLYPPEETADLKILAWSADPETADAVTSLASAFGKLLGSSSALAQSPGLNPDAVLNMALEGHYNLTVLNPPPAQIAYLLSHSVTPLLLVRGKHTQLRRILIVWRGFSSDNHVLDWVIPLAQQPDSQVIVMPLTESPTRDLDDLLNGNGSAKRHIEACLGRFKVKGIQTRLKIRQGRPVDQVVDELAQSEYDLLVIAAEGHGDFVTQVLTAIEERGVHSGRPVFILKPPFVE